MSIEKDGYFAHQVMWNGWVDTDKYQTYIVGHWNYDKEMCKPVYVVSNGESVELFLNGSSLGKGKRDYNFLFTFDKVNYKPGKLEVVSYDKGGKVISKYALSTVGEPASIKLTVIENPEGFKADGADLAIVQFEVVDKEGRRCPLDNRQVNFSVNGDAEWRGGIAQGEDNYILSKFLPVECGINRAFIRSGKNPGKIVVTAKADGLPTAKVELRTNAVKNKNGLSEYLPQYTLKSKLEKGATPTTPSYVDSKLTVDVKSVETAVNKQDAENCYDDNELSVWANDGKLNTAWITFNLEREALVDDICLKMTGWRLASYPLEVFDGEKLIWRGNTDKSLG